MREVKERPGWWGACHRGRASAAERGSAVPPHPPSSLPGDSPLWRERIKQGEQCHYNTVPLNYSPTLRGNIVPGLFLLRFRALHLAQLL